MKGKVTIKRKPPPIEDVLPLGLVVHDLDGHAWVYVGYRLTTVGSVKRTFRAALPFAGKWVDWESHAVKRATLIERFADLAPHWPEGEAA